MRIAATADLHFTPQNYDRIREQMNRVRDDADIMVLAGACLPLSSLSVPLLPLRTAVRTLSAPDRPVLDTAGGAGQAAERFDSWLDELCDARPVALVVDDMQWADSATLDVLMWVLASLVNRPLVVLGTLRRGEVRAGHPLQRWLADVRRLPGFTELSLGPLDLETTRAQVADLLGGVPHDALVRQVYDRTGGNAYLNRLLVAGLPVNAPSLGDALPHDLAAAVLRRWHELSPGIAEAVIHTVVHDRDPRLAASEPEHQHRGDAQRHAHET